MEGESDVWFAVGSERQHPLIIHFCLNDYRCFYFFRSGGGGKLEDHISFKRSVCQSACAELGRQLLDDNRCHRRRTDRVGASA